MSFTFTFLQTEHNYVNQISYHNLLKNFYS